MNSDSAQSVFAPTALISRRRGRFWCHLFLGVVLAGTAYFASGLDAGVREGLQNPDLPGDLVRVVTLMEIFGHGTGLWIAVALILTLGPRFRGQVPRLIAAYAASGLFVNLIKLLVPRLRPLAESGETFSPSAWNLEHISQSFPSGHSATAVTVAISLAYIFPRGRWVFLILASLACLQRLQEAHWLSDVLAGAAIGLWVTGLLYAWAPADWLFRRFEGTSAKTSA